MERVDKIITDGVEWITATDCKENWGITYNRLKLWREGKGQARWNELRVLKLNNKYILYNKLDVENLVNLTELSKLV